MPKIPDLSKLANKIDIQGLMDNVKSMITPESQMPKPPEGDELAEKAALLISSIQEVANNHTEQTKLIQQLSKDINALYKSIEALHKAEHPEEHPESQQPSKKAAKPAEEKPAETKPAEPSVSKEDEK